MFSKSPFEELDFHEGVKLAQKMGVERYDTPESKNKQKLKAADRIAEALDWLVNDHCMYDSATSRVVARQRLKEYREL